MSGPGAAPLYDIGKGDADDEEWFSDLARKNKKEQREKYGGGPEPKGRKAREAAAAAAAAAKEAKAGRGNDPYMLRAGSGRAAVRKGRQRQ